MCLWQGVVRPGQSARHAYEDANVPSFDACSKSTDATLRLDYYETQVDTLLDTLSEPRMSCANRGHLQTRLGRWFQYNNPRHMTGLTGLCNNI